jgi:hypothetical protein
MNYPPLLCAPPKSGRVPAALLMTARGLTEKTQAADRELELSYVSVGFLEVGRTLPMQRWPRLDRSSPLSNLFGSYTDDAPE